MKINDLHKLFLNFQELDHNSERVPQDPREISRNIMKINDLRKADPANQRVTYGTTDGTDGTDKTVGRDSVEP